MLHQILPFSYLSTALGNINQDPVMTSYIQKLDDGKQTALLLQPPPAPETVVELKDMEAPMRKKSMVICWMVVSMPVAEAAMHHTNLLTRRSLGFSVLLKDLHLSGQEEPGLEPANQSCHF